MNKKIYTLFCVISLISYCAMYAMEQEHSLHKAAHAGDLSVVKKLLAHPNVNVDSIFEKPWYGVTPLAYAANSGNVDVVQALLDAGADPNFIVSGLGNIPLILAKNNIPIIKALLKAGADVNSATNLGFTALHRAAYHGWDDVVEILLDAGANIYLGAVWNRNSDSSDGLMCLQSKIPLDLVFEKAYESVSWAPNYGKIIKLLQARDERLRNAPRETRAFVMANHPRLGKQSPAHVLPQDIFRYVYYFLKK